VDAKPKRSKDRAGKLDHRTSDGEKQLRQQSSKKRKQEGGDIDVGRHSKKASPQLTETARLAEVGDAQLARESVPIVKDLYREHEETSAMTEAEVVAFREARRIAVAGCDLRPVKAFHQLGFKKKLLKAVQDFKMPSPIQAQCWPIVLSGRDLIGIAATGSGETAMRSFLLHACWPFHMPALRHSAPCLHVRDGVVCRQNAGVWPAGPTSRP
jgi:ATP-dependent RNA helicase DBP3